MESVLMIAGPTASGKSALAMALAQRTGAHIVSADALQVYQGMDIGTAKPTVQEQQAVPHHMIDVVGPDQPYTVALYREAAMEIIQSLLAKHIPVIVVGGTGLYLRSLRYPMDFGVAGQDEAFREQCRIFTQAHGVVALHQRLAQVDEVAAARLHPNDVKRVVRALEVHHVTGKPFSSFETDYRSQPSPFPITPCALKVDRPVLYQRINRRVEIMMKQGLLAEVSALYKQYPGADTALQALGYKELIAHLKGECTLPQAVDAIQQGTRNFAKRQMTLFLRDPWEWVDVTHGLDSAEQNIYQNWNMHGKPR